MIVEVILNRISKTEECRILDEEERNTIPHFANFTDVIEVQTDVSLEIGVKQIVLYITFSSSSKTELPKIFIQKESYEDLKYLPHINGDLNVCIYDVGMNHIFHESSLPDIVEEMIHKAKKIISQFDNDEEINNREFDREFKAYWEISYHRNDNIRTDGLALVTSNDHSVKGLAFESGFQQFKFLIYQESEEFNRFKYYLDARKIAYKDIEVFAVQFPKVAPPFSISFRDSIHYFDEKTVSRFKSRINSLDISSVLVVFKNNNNEYYGWRYGKIIPPTSSIKGRITRLTNWEIITGTVFQNSLVERLLFSDLNPNRLQIRTRGESLLNDLSISLVGIGSVGSNLLNYISKLPVNHYYLVDSEGLEIDNVFRHQYGFDFVNFPKADIAKLNILNKNPFCVVDVKKESILDVLVKEREFLNKADCNLIVVGNTLVESQILNHMDQTNCSKPVIIIWIEPFMASGQMLFVNPSDFSRAKKIILDYQFHVLTDHQNDITYLKEGSCQSGYYPYSELDLTLFLCAIFRHLTELIANRQETRSTIFTWVGDKESIKRRGLEITSFGQNHNSFELTINNL